MSMLAAIVVCSVAIPVQNCNERVAKDIYISPESYEVPFKCQQEAMIYAADHQIIRPPKEYIKVYCGESRQILKRFGSTI